MRKLPLFLLLASAAVPALAAPGDEDREGGRHHRDGNATEQSESRPQGVRETRQPDTNNEQRSVRTERIERSQAGEQGIMERIREQHQQREQSAAASTQSDDGPRTRNWRRNNDGTGQSTWQPRERHVRTIPDTQPQATTQGRRGDVARAFEGRSRPDYRNGNYRRWTDNLSLIHI